MNNIKNPSPNVMNTWTGRQFDPLHMQPSDVSLEDIAHALSLLCRGGGHLDRFYSVGQHCINCAGEARARGWSDRLHDLTPEEKASWKQIDDDMLRGELREMIVSTRELPPILLASVPDFAEHPHWETEEAFLKEANDLLKLLRK